MEHSHPDGGPVNRQRLVDHVGYEARCRILRRLDVTVEWRVLDWVEDSSCANLREATDDACRRCSVVAECLAAAMATDDPADWRGGLSRVERERIWAGIERTFADLRDLEAMRLNPLEAASVPTALRRVLPPPNLTMRGDRS